MCCLQNIAMCDYQESVTTGQTHTETDGQTDRRRTKWSLCATMLHRRHKNYTLLFVCFCVLCSIQFYFNGIHILFELAMNQVRLKKREIIHGRQNKATLPSLYLPALTSSFLALSGSSSFNSRSFSALLFTSLCILLCPSLYLPVYPSLPFSLPPCTYLQFPGFIRVLFIQQPFLLCPSLNLPVYPSLPFSLPPCVSFSALLFTSLHLPPVSWLYQGPLHSTATPSLPFSLPPCIPFSVLLFTSLCTLVCPSLYLPALTSSFLALSGSSSFNSCSSALLFTSLHLPPVSWLYQGPLHSTATPSLPFSLPVSPYVLFIQPSLPFSLPPCVPFSALLFTSLHLPPVSSPYQGPLHSTAAPLPFSLPPCTHLKFNSHSSPFSLPPRVPLSALLFTSLIQQPLLCPSLYLPALTSSFLALSGSSSFNSRAFSALLFTSLHLPPVSWPYQGPLHSTAVPSLPFSLPPCTYLQFPGLIRVLFIQQPLLLCPSLFLPASLGSLLSLGVGQSLVLLLRFLAILLCLVPSLCTELSGVLFWIIIMTVC